MSSILARIGSINRCGKVLAFLMASFFVINFSNAAYAATRTNGIITDANDIRWEYELIDGTGNENEPQILSIKFYDKPENLTTVTVPSLTDVKGLVPGASASLDTYYLRDADTDAQDANYTELTRRESVDTTVLDMTNTSKIQILGVKPIINPEVETELVFGENMVLGDQSYKEVKYGRCNMELAYTGASYYWCRGTQDEQTSYYYRYSMDSWLTMTDEEWASYELTPSGIGMSNCYLGNGVTVSDYRVGRCYITVTTNTADGEWRYSYYSNEGYLPQKLGQAFSGYKLKLTNFAESNFNYIGWETFKDSTFNDANTTMTIEGDAFAGGDIFRNTNIQKAIIKTENIGVGIFRDCASLTEIEFDDSITKTTNAAFAGSGLTSFDFSSTNIKKISPNTFDGAELADVNLDGIERIEFEAFRNTQLTELYLPKSINWLGCSLFESTELKKVTVAYDTLTKGAILQFNTVLGGGWYKVNGRQGPVDTIEELNVIAPYSSDDQLSDTRISYTDYWIRTSPSREDYEQQSTWPRCTHLGGGAGVAYNDCWGSIGNSTFKAADSLGDYLQFELDYADLESKKNIIAPRYFMNLHALKKITVGEGYEYIGAQAFVDYDRYSSGSTWNNRLSCGNDGCGTRERDINEISLPDSLRGVGYSAFESIWSPNMDFEIPSGIEFIGYAAFRRVFFYRGNVDFPNLVALGDFAFDSTSVHNIVLHDKLRFMGVMVFADCPNINDVTFDLDIFNPDIYISWATPGRSAHFSGDNFQFRDQFGKPSQGSFTKRDMERWGFKPSKHSDDGESYNGGGLQFGKITFTEKAISLDSAKQFSSNYNLATGRNNDFFAYVSADMVDIGKTGWKELTAKMFDHAFVDEIILPANLEAIPGGAFQGAQIKEELIIPDSVKIIGDKAFACGQYNVGGYYSDTVGCDDDHAIKITKLPTSLEYVGNEAFYADVNLTADLNSPNLKRVYIRAFTGTHLRDIVLPSGMQVLREATFGAIPTLRNITIDFDLGALPPSSEPTWGEFSWPESLVNFAGDNIYDFLSDDNFETSTGYNASYRIGAGTITFYTLFNQNYNGQSLDSGNYYEKLTLTENVKTPIYMTNGGYFSNLRFGTIDMSNSQLEKISGLTGAGLFDGAVIDNLILPQQLKNLSSRAFMRVNVTNTIEIPNTVTRVEDDVFMEANLSGNVIFEDGSDEMTFVSDWNNTFLRATVDGTVSIPGRVKNLSGQNFMEAKLGGLELAEGVETIGKNVFLRAEIGDKVVIPSSMREIGENGFMEAKMDGLELKNGIEKFGYCSFIRAEIGGSFSFPGTVKEIGASAFMYAKMHTTGSFKEGLKTVGAGAFIHTNFADDLVIPSTVESIGWSAFNAGDADVHYNTVVIKPNLTIASASNQRVHQLLWNTSVDELTIDSNMLVAIDQGIEGPVSATDGGEEFWNMDIKKVTLNNLPKITYAAFNKCDKLEEVDMSRNANIRDIDDRAFAGDAKLHIIKFSPNIKNEDVRVGQYAFEGTAFTSIGDSSKDIDITAAKFYGTDGYAFAEMPKVETVDVPATFSYATIPEATFYNDPELREATVAYETTLMGNAAFANDNKLERIFIWGNTVVLDENLPGYEAPVGGMGADGDDVDGADGDTTDEEEVGPTIPVGTDIYAYSVSPTEAYAGYDGRDDFEGVFYPLDEVLYITSNKPYVKLSDDGNDFDKSQLTVYALRRDGLVLESNDWSTWDGTVYSRNSANLTFEHMPEVMADNPAFGTVWDTPVPINLLDFGNENFAEIDFTLEKDPSMEEGVRKVNIVYTDKYTRGVPDTDIIPYTLPETPFTYAVNILCYVALLAGCAFVFRWAMKGMRRGK